MSQLGRLENAWNWLLTMPGHCGFFFHPPAGSWGLETLLHLHLSEKKKFEDNSLDPVTTYTDKIVDLENVGESCFLTQTVPAVVNTCKPFRVLKICS